MTSHTDKDTKEISFTCDECSTGHIDTGHRDFADARRVMHHEGWRTFKGPDGEYAHACKGCVAAYAAEQRR